MEYTAQYITPKQVGELLQIGHRQATNLVKKLPGAIKIGNEWRATEIALHKHLEMLSAASKNAEDGKGPLPLDF